MKKLLKAAGIISIAASFFLTSCSEPMEYDSRTDTVQSLGKPSIQATAYPGVNYISWSPVTGADGYALYKKAGGSVEMVFSDSHTALSYSDTSVKNGVVYTYWVEAESNSSTSTSRAVVTENSMSDSVNVTGILPPAGTEALKLADYENPAANGEYNLSASNLTLARSNDRLVVEFPAKAYLEYNVWFLRNNEYELTGSATLSSAADRSTGGINDTTLSLYGTITSPGVYKARVVAKSVSEFYADSELISTASVTVEDLGGTWNSTSLAVAYTDEGETVRCTFYPYTLPDGSKADLASYKVFRAVSGTSQYEALSVAVKASTADESGLFFDDTIADNSKAYQYKIAVSVDGEYSTGVTATLSAYSTTTTAVTFSSTASTQEEDGILNDIEWTLTVPATATLKGVYALAVPVENNKVVAADFDTTTSLPFTVGAGNDDEDKYSVYTTIGAYGQKVCLLAVTEQAGKTVQTVGSSSAKTIALVAMNNPSITISSCTETAGTTGSYDVTLNLSDTISAGDTIENYSYTIYRAILNTKDWPDSDKWTTVATMTGSEIAKDTNITGTTTLTYTDSAVKAEVGKYICYRLEKTHKISGENAVDSASQQVTATNP